MPTPWLTPAQSGSAKTRFGVSRALSAAVAMIAVLFLALLSGCGASDAEGADTTSVVRVPGDAPTIAEAVEEVSDGGLVLVSPGVYEESITVEKPGITIRGTDRNEVIIDGQGQRSVGILVSAPGVTVQNLTVRAHTFYGLLVTGMPGGGSGRGGGYSKLDPEEFPPVQRFHIDHVTAVNNGLYGIYAFDSQHGVIEDSYASGSADSGFYVGQCRECDIVVRNNVAERNAVGFENANASDSVYIVGNRWSGNRIGMTLITSYQEAFVPQRSNIVAGNLISENTSADSPAQANGGFGLGIGVSGGQDNTIRGNRIIGNPRAGVLLSNAEDIPATGNKITGNVMSGNGIDAADTSSERTPSAGNCTSGGAQLTVAPAALEAAICPDGSAKSAGLAANELPQVAVPAGMSFLDVPAPRPQTNWPGTMDEPPAPLPASIGAPELSEVDVPSADYLADRTGHQ